MSRIALPIGLALVAMITFAASAPLRGAGAPAVGPLTTAQINAVSYWESSYLGLPDLTATVRLVITPAGIVQ